MDLHGYKENMPSEISKSDLLTSIELAISISNTFMEMRANLTKAVSANVGKASDLNNINRRFKMVLKNNPFGYFTKNSKNFITNLQALRAKVEDLPESTDTSSTTLDVISTVALVEAYQVSTGWLLKYIHEVVRAGYIKSLKGNDDVADEMAAQKSVIRALNENSAQAVWALKVTTVSPEEFIKSFAEENALFVTRSGTAEMKASGRLKGNPLNDPTASGFNGNPFYAIGTYAASWVAHSHGLATEELTQLELMLSELEADGKGNPEVETQLIVLNQRIADKRQLLKDLES